MAAAVAAGVLVGAVVTDVVVTAVGLVVVVVGVAVVEVGAAVDGVVVEGRGARTVVVSIVDRDDGLAAADFDTTVVGAGVIEATFTCACILCFSCLSRSTRWYCCWR